MKPKLPFVLGLLASVLCLPAFAQGTAFTYQGRLNDGANPANGVYDLTFSVWKAASGSGQVGSTLVKTNATISGGLFTVTLDFGPDVFDGAGRWLEIGVHTNGATAFTTLSPRQWITATPYAMTASNLTGLLPAGQLTGTISNAQLSANVSLLGASIESAEITDGTIVNADIAASAAVVDTKLATIATAGKVANSALSASVSLLGQTIESAEITDGTIAAADVNAASFNTTFWRTAGNAGTTPGTHFLGTTDNQPLEFTVKNWRALRLEPTINIDTVNVIGGSARNIVAAGVVGATIGGGGSGYYGSVAYTNMIAADFGTIGGGTQNRIAPLADSGAIGGGHGNDIGTNSENSTIGGGWRNTIAANSGKATIAGGYDNEIGTNSDSSVIGGGFDNGIGANSGASTISGGGPNLLAADVVWGTIAGGGFNTIGTDSASSVISGGYHNNIGANAQYANIVGGYDNDVGNDSAYSTIAGGATNSIGANSASGVIGGGNANHIAPNSFAATMAGGYANAIGTNADLGVISGGFANNIGANSTYSTIGGGFANHIAPDSSADTIAGGYTNAIGANSDYSAIGGGSANNIAANVQYATIPGGYFNSATKYAFAAGRQAKANHQGAFVWADSTALDFASTGNDEFDVRATGGLHLENNTSQFFGNNTRQMLNLYSTTYGIGVQSSALYHRSNGEFYWYRNGVHSDTLGDSGGGTTLMHLSASELRVNGTFVSASDRNLKENFAPINARDVLAKVTALPLTQWNYKADSGTRHLGPMAQDFYAAFGTGSDDKHIATVDADGVALAAIQGLNQKFEEQRAENAELKQQVAELKQLVLTLATKH